MSFEKYSKKLQSALDNAIEEVNRHHKYEEDVDVLRNTIDALKLFIQEIDCNFSFCVDYYGEIVEKHNLVQDNLYTVIDVASHVVDETCESNMVRLTYDQFRLLYMKSEPEKYEDTYGIKLIDTTMNESHEYVKHYVFKIIDEKKWGYNKIKLEL